MLANNVKRSFKATRVSPNFFLLFLLVVLPLAVAGCSQEDSSENQEEQEQAANREAEEEQEEEEEEEIIPDPIQPVGVVIDNINRARPQSGLQEATRVYEFLVEGGITRFLAFYDLPFEEDFEIGPVRSLRPYMAHQALEHGGIVAHGGYSSRTAEEIREMDLQHLANGDMFWRDGSRPSPHNMYTSMERLRQAAGEENVPRDSGTPLEEVEAEYRQHEGKQEQGDRPVIEIEYNSNNRVSYRYDPEKENYLRYINGQPHKDLSGEQYYARRVILRKTPHRPIPDTPLVSIELKGEGEGTLYEQGREYPVTWEKGEESTRYYFEDGSLVDASRGTTWIQVVE